MIRRFAFALVVASLALACKGGSAAKLEGRWRGIKATGVSTDRLPDANLFASTMELEFKGDVVSVHIGSEKQSGKFRVVKDEKTAVVLVTDQDGPDDKQTFTFTDDHTMEWAVASGKTIQFAKE